MVASRILIVEDERLIAFDLQRRLSQLGHTVVGTVSSGAEAVMAAHQLQPDLILMDIRLQGDMDGIDAALRIREERAIPIIFLTAYVDEATFQRAQALSPSGFLHKPFHIGELRAVLPRTADEQPRNQA